MRLEKLSFAGPAAPKAHRQGTIRSNTRKPAQRIKYAQINSPWLHLPTGCPLFTKSYRRLHRLARTVRRSRDKRISKLFSKSLWQMTTAPPPQPQSKLIAQKGIALAAFMARARLSTTRVNGMSIPNNSKAE